MPGDVAPLYTQVRCHAVIGRRNTTLWPAGCLMTCYVEVPFTSSLKMLSDSENSHPYWKSEYGCTNFLTYPVWAEVLFIIPFGQHCHTRVAVRSCFVACSRSGGGGGGGGDGCGGGGGGGGVTERIVWKGCSHLNSRLMENVMVSYYEYHRTGNFNISIYGVRLLIRKKNIVLLLVNNVYLCNIYGLSSIESENSLLKCMISVWYNRLCFSHRAIC